MPRPVSKSILKKLAVKWVNSNPIAHEPDFTLDLVIPHKPRAQARPRAAMIKCGSYQRATMYKPKENMMAEEEIRRYWLELMETLEEAQVVMFPWAGPVRMSVNYMFATPKEYWEGREKDSKPDMDNLQKMLQDALNKYAWADDSQIVAKHTEKTFGNPEGIYARFEFYSKVEKPVRVRAPKKKTPEAVEKEQRRADRDAKLIELLKSDKDL